jgi:D-alanine-D-alanine ligase
MSAHAVIFGGPSPEHDISILTGLQASRVLLDNGHQVIGVYWAKSGQFHSVSPSSEAEAFVNGLPPGSKRLNLLLAGDNTGFQETGGIRRSRPVDIDVVVNCCHGGPGEDGRLQSALDLAGVRYTGPTARGAALGMDKLAFGAVAAGAGIPTLPRHAIHAGVSKPDFDPPWILKPRYGGSSIGIEIVEDFDTALHLVDTSAHFRAGAVIEPFLLDAVDLNVSVRGTGEPAISEIERPLKDGKGIYSYAEKYLTGGAGITGAPRELPAELPTKIRQRINECASSVARLGGVRGVARIDFLLSGDEVWLNEINTIPGALSFYLWRASGVSYIDLMRDMIKEARSAPTYEAVLAGADGLALRGAASIARKLA